ncbi:MAG: family 20 glycosylhydrolase [Lentisphaeria bacterium]|nr:family 20 glycosylhydrolase [Lentisphaeria bacterium]
MKKENVSLFPVPAGIRYGEGTRDLSHGQWILLPEDAGFPLKKRVMEMAQDLSASFVLPPQVSAGVPSAGEILLQMKRNGKLPGEGYRLVLKKTGGFLLEASSDAGFFYGMQSVSQLLASPEKVPLLAITDVPSMKVRGYMLDISRAKVPTMETMKSLVKSLAALRYNALQLYMEHTFRFAAHERVWASCSPFTPEEIMILDEYCREHFVELVPNLNSFGHLNRWLKLEEYKHLAECDPPYIHKSGNPMQGVLHPCGKSLAFVESLYREFLPNFTSRKLNIGCDETVELGKGKSSSLCKKKGVAQVYLSFLRDLAATAGKFGFSVQFWGDIIMHNPELIGELPKGITALEWGYEYNHPFREDTAKFAASKVPFLVCPGTSSWQTILGRTTNMLGNIANAVVNGCRNGAEGMLMTDWGDGGHHQYYPVSWPGIAYGGALAWNANTVKASEELLPYGIALAFAPRLSRKEGMRLGKFLMDAGTVYDDFSTRVSNSTSFGRILPAYPRENHNSLWLQQMKKEETDKAERHVRKLLAELVAHPFAGFPLENREMVNAFRMSLAALAFLRRVLGGNWDRAKFRDDLRHVISEHEELWLARNRSGGLYESSSVLRRAMDYDPDSWKKR